jgi:hypothetical protein
MRQDRPVATGEDGHRPIRLWLQHVMADRVDATVKAVKAAGLDPPGNSMLADAEAPQLIAGDEPILAPRTRRQARIHRGLGAFCTHLGR